ncbi:hypothetical protein BLOT_004576 [Blomia tropicalis]|nr:hypothetical protein BLOT_004576 [Blomia tropicalis]
MHYSPINAITAASPASASPSSSSVSPSSHIYQSHHGQHHLSGNDHSIHSMGEQNELMATAAAVSHHMSSDGMNSGSPITFVTTKVEPCDDLSPTNSTTYTTLQTASTPGTQNTQNSHQNGGHHHHHYNTDHPMAGPTSNGTPKSGNGSNKRNGTTATKSSYNSHNKSGNGDHSRSSSSTGPSSNSGRVQQGGGKKTKGRVKIKMEFIDNKLRRYTTFSKRKTGIMKKI